MRCDICGKRIYRGGGIKIYDNDVLIGYYHKHCCGNSWISQAEEKKRKRILFSKEISPKIDGRFEEVQDDSKI